MLKKVRELTVEDLVSLGRADNVSNLRITIQDPNTENKHWDVNIGGVGYGRKLFLDDEVEVPDKNSTPFETLQSVLMFKVHYQYGQVEFVDMDNETIQTTEVNELSKIDTKFYGLVVQYTELLPTDNPYRDKVVARIKFISRTKEELRKMKY